MSLVSSRRAFIALRTLLRSLGQVVLQPNAITGSGVLAAWVLYSPRLACAALLGAAIANADAMLAKQASRDTLQGLHGFNGALAALAVFTFIHDNALAISLALLASLGTAWLLGPWSRWLRRYGLCFYSSPCLLVTALWLPFITISNPASPPLHAPSTSLLSHAANWLSGLAQSGFATGAWPGLLMLAGIAIASRRHAIWALLGSGLASSAHLLLGATDASFNMGLLGFNGALTGLALADAGILAALGGISLSVVLQHFANSYGLLALTTPFVLATWSMQRLKLHAHKSLRADAAR
ncbi:urea transporter [Paraburkholderia bonniea]|uniref:urea transporter n=1 Tax=Paraburkholderia bonniea TaxID=2152891 RepID=UPI00129150E1|nr:urea transporter [Paraburkholderia bonniea]WJF91557.1 urea transporter [Paraburkholderia bonniea]WJF94876.1 urea transporter [Paraburkholderia bonniea]